MANIQLIKDESYTVVNNKSSVFATSAGIETVTVGYGISELKIDANTDKVQFIGKVSDYTYLKSGTEIEIYSDNKEIFMTKFNIGENAKSFTFKDGTVDVKISLVNSKQVMTLGDTVVSDSTPGAVVPKTIDDDIVWGQNTFTLQEIPSAFKGYLWNGVNIPSILSGLQTLTLDAADGDTATDKADLSWYSTLYQSLLTNYQVWEKPKPVLTPTAQSKGVLEGGADGTARTSDANDTIQGDTFAINGAYVDGGGGHNTLIVDMKGPFAQPARLANIQTIIVQNMPNIYTGQDVTGKPVGQGEDIYPNDPLPAANTDAVLNAGSASMLDLSRALDVKKVIATESIIGDSDDKGTLTLLNIQNGATLRMEGNFNAGVVFHYGVGVPAVVDLELYAVHSNNGVKIASDAYKVNLASLGGQNVLEHANLNKNLENLVITGDARLVINDPMDNFAKYGIANIDASANTGGVAISVTGHENVKFTGTATNDQFGFLGGSAVLNIATGAGRDTVLLNGVNALAGTNIGGTDITLQIGSGDTDLVDATLVSVIPVDETGKATGSRVGITSVILEDKLVISQNQFSQLGASVFNGYRNDEGLLRVEISDKTKVTALSSLVRPSDLDDVNLEFDIKEGATLTITAEELHKYVSDGGIVKGAGKLIITDAGLKFNPYEFNDLYAGGTLDASFKEGVNLTVIRLRVEDGGFERPGAAPSTDTLIIDTTTPVVAAGDPTPPTSVEITTPVTSELTTFIVKGDRDLVVTQPVDLGKGFVLNFSALTGKLRGSNHDSLTINNFEDVKAIIGNGATHDVRINVGLGGQVGKDDITKGLNSKGVQTYVVTDIHNADNADNDGDGKPDAAVQDFYVCDSTQNLTTLGLQKNDGDTINFLNVKWGVNFLMEGDGLVNYTDPLKADGPPDSSNIGTLNATFAYPGAPAVVKITNQGVDLGKTSTGTPRGFDVDGIKIDNAKFLTVNVEDGNAVIDNINGNQLASLTLTTESIKNADGAVSAEGSLVIEEALPTTLTAIDATGVDGAITATLDDMLHAFTFKADNGFNLTLNGALKVDDVIQNFDADPGTVITGGAGTGDILNIIGNVNLANATLDKIDAVVMTTTYDDGKPIIPAVTLTADDILEIGAAKITVDAPGHAATLNVANLSTAEFSISSTAGINLGTVTIAAATDPTKPDVTLNAKTDLTGADEVKVLAGTKLNMTATQFRQLQGTGTITGAGTVNITDLTQADIDAGFDLSGVDPKANGTITLAADAKLVELTDATKLNGFAIELAKDQTIKLATADQAHNTIIKGAANTTVEFGFTFGDLTTGVDLNHDGVIAADEHLINTANYSNISKLVVLDTLVEGQNVEKVLYNLDSSIVVDVIKDVDADLKNRIVVVEPNVKVDGGLVFDDLHDNLEIATLDLTLKGGVDIDGDLNISEAGLKLTGSGFQKLTITSEGAAANEMGNILAKDNNLFDVNIKADQALTIDTVTLSSEYYTEKAAKLTVTGSANVEIDALVESTTDKYDITALSVVNDGDGILTLHLDSNTIELTAIDGDGADAAKGGAILNIDNVVDLSKVSLDGIDKVVMESGAELTLTAVEIKAIGETNFSVVDKAAGGVAEVLNINNFGADKAIIDIKVIAAKGIDVQEITIAKTDTAAVTLDKTIDLTDVDKILVPQGVTLTMTAAQFQQLKGNGTIEGVDQTTDFTVNIIDLKQADIDGSNKDTTQLILSDVKADHAKLILAESVIFDDKSVLSNFAIDLADKYNVTFSTDVQAHERVIDGGTTTAPNTVAFAFTEVSTTVKDFNKLGIDTAGYNNITTLEVTPELIEGWNVEQLLANLDIAFDSNNDGVYEDDGTIVKVVNPEDMPGAITNTREVVIEVGVTIGIEDNKSLIFDDLHINREVKQLELTLEGGVKVEGDIDIKEAVQANNGKGFQKLIINSTGTPVTVDPKGDDPNVMGNILATNNNLFDVAINAAQELKTGVITFSSNIKSVLDEKTGDLKLADTATLTVTGTKAVTIQQLNAADTDITTMKVVNNSTSLTVTGASPAFTGNVETLNLSGSGAIVFGSIDPASNINDLKYFPGISSDTLSILDASKLTGALDLGEIYNVDSEAFAFTSGSGKTTLTLNGDDSMKGVIKNATWSFDMSTAAAGSVLTIEDNENSLDTDNGNAFDDDKGTLSINLGANAGIVIDSKDEVDFSHLKTLTITDASPTSTITVEQDAVLTMTAAQASGKSIVTGSGITNDDGTPRPNGKVVITDLEDVKAADLAKIDFSGINADVEIKLGNDVTLPAGVKLSTGNIQVSGAELTIDKAVTYNYTQFKTEIEKQGDDVTLPYTLLPVTEVNEGNTATYIVKTKDVADDTKLSYVLSGIEVADITGTDTDSDNNLLTGSVTIKNNTATISVTTNADNTKEGSGFETMTVTLGNNFYVVNTKIIDVNDSINPTFAPTTSTPVDNATGVAIDKNIILDFSETVVIADATGIKLLDASGNPVPASVTLVSGDIVIDPTEPLLNDTDYHVTIAATAVKDAVGNPFAGIVDTTVFDFKTVAAVDPAPQFAPTTSTPADNATDVAIDKNITLDFSEPVVIVDPTGIKLFDATGKSIDIATPTVSANGDIVINPTAPLLNDTGYYVQIAATAVKESVGGKLFAGIADTTTFNFKTVTVPDNTGIPMVNGGTYEATDGADIFVYEFSDFTGGSYETLAMAGTDGTVTITGFDSTKDTIRFLDTDGTPPTQAEFLAEKRGYSVTPDGFNTQTTVSLFPYYGEEGNDAAVASDIILQGYILELKDITITVA